MSDLGDAPSRHSCPECGTVLRRGRRPGRGNHRGLCETCLRRRTVPFGYDPRCDPDFERRWLSHLILHAMEWCHPSDLWASSDESQRVRIRLRAHEVVQAATRLGLAVESDARMGYRVTGHVGLPRYLHLHERAEDRSEATMPGQLTLAECEAVS